MRIIIVDGQGGGVGRALVDQLKRTKPDLELIAIGTNAIATSAMLRAGADRGATGENAIRVCCERADIIAGPIGILMADAMLGEITPEIARCVGASDAKKVLIPSPKSGILIAGSDPSLPLSALLEDAVRRILDLLPGKAESNVNQYTE